MTKFTSLVCVAMLLCSISAFGQIPTINSFTPASGVAGTTVTLTGANFNATPANNIVRFQNGLKGTVTSSSATSISVVVPAGVMTGGISVLNKSTGLIGKSPIYFKARVPKLSLIPTTFFDPSFNISGVQNSYDGYDFMDLNGDGKTDIISNGEGKKAEYIKNISSPGVLNANSFAPKKLLFADENEGKMLFVDWNGDDKQDIVYRRYVAGIWTVYIRLNESVSGDEPVFSDSIRLVTAYGAKYELLAAGDIDGDGKQDVYVNYNYEEIIWPNGEPEPYVDPEIIYHSTNYLLRNTSTMGTNDVSFSTIETDLFRVIDDIDADGKPDFMIYKDGKLSIRRNTSAPGNVSSVLLHELQNRFDEFIFRDIDGDNMLDMVAWKKSAPEAVYIYRNNIPAGATTNAFDAPVSLNPGNYIVDVIVQDVEGDNKPDIWINALPNPNTTNPFVIYHNRSQAGSLSNASFAKFTTTYEFTNDLRMGTFVDFDNDGKPDFFSEKLGFRCISRYNPKSLSIPFSTSVKPTKAVIGQDVVITGNDFNTDISKNEVWFGGVKAKVNSVNTTTINVKVPYGTSYQAISVLNKATGYTKYTKENFIPIFSAQVQVLSPAVSYTAGNKPSSVAMADVNGDGKLDMVVANSGSSTVSVYRNMASSGSLSAASFSDKVDFQTGESPAFVIVKDINHDGKPDILTANFGTNTISILRNTSPNAGAISVNTFASKVDIVTGTHPSSLSLGDIDNDGRADIAVANSGGNTVSVLKNRCTLSNPTAIVFDKTDFIVGANPSSVVLSDLDNDNKPDIVTTLYGAGKIAILLNVTEWTRINAASFGPKVEFTSGIYPQYLVIGDVSGDGKPDVVVANKGGKTIAVFRNTAIKGNITSSSLAPKFDLAPGASVVALALGDINGDGALEIISANNDLNSISVFSNANNEFSFNTASFTRNDWSAGTSPQGVITGDADGDGKTDIAVANFGSNTFEVLRNASPSVGVLSPPVITSFTPAKATTGTTITITGQNFDSNPTKNDVLFAGTKAEVLTATATLLKVKSPAYTAFKQISVLNKITNLSATSNVPFNPTFNGKSNITSNDFSPAVSFSSASNPHGIAFGDIDDDGKPDMVSANENTISVFKNISSQGTINSSSFASEVRFSIPVGGLSKPVIADIDGDGKPEIIIGTRSGLSVFRNITAKGVINFISFDTRVDIKQRYNANVAVEDMDNDGKPDIIVNLYEEIVILRNACTIGNITPAGFVEVKKLTDILVESMTIADIDGDGKKDIAFGQSLTVFQNITQPGAIPDFKMIKFPNVTAASYTAFADFNDDGKMDIVFTYYGKLGVLYGNATKGNISSSAFSMDRSVVVPFKSTYGYPVHVADFDGDGRPDVITSNTIFKNNGSALPTKITLDIPLTSYLRETFDLDGDGAPEIAYEQQSTGKINIIKNNLIQPLATLAKGLTSLSVTGTEGQMVSVYPNPAVKTIGFQLSGYKGGNISVLLTNLNGKVIHSETMAVSPFAAYYPLNMANTPPQGIYVLKVTGTALSESSKIIVQ